MESHSCLDFFFSHIQSHLTLLENSIHFSSLIIYYFLASGNSGLAFSLPLFYSTQDARRETTSNNTTGNNPGTTGPYGTWLGNTQHKATQTATNSNNNKTRRQTSSLQQHNLKHNISWQYLESNRIKLKSQRDETTSAFHPTLSL